MAININYTEIARTTSWKDVAQATDASQTIQIKGLHPQTLHPLLYPAVTHLYNNPHRSLFLGLAGTIFLAGGIFLIAYLSSINPPNPTPALIGKITGKLVAACGLIFIIISIGNYYLKERPLRKMIEEDDKTSGRPFLLHILNGGETHTFKS